MKEKRKDILQLVSMGVLLAVLLVLELLKDKIFGDEITYIAATRAVAGLACVMLVLRAGYGQILVPKIKPRHMLTVLPCMAVAVNNFPLIPFFSGQAVIDGTLSQIAVYALSCFAVGLFEEMAFRGCIFSAVLQRIGNRRAGVFLSIVVSSAVFGVIHLANLLAGASPIYVILQIGYSFLIGAMCATVLVRTGNIWYCVLIHGVYNFAGGVIPTLGHGEIWTSPEIILTVAVAIPVAVYVIYLVATAKYRTEADNADI